MTWVDLYYRLNIYYHALAIKYK